jgi:hypothetical protein
MHDQVSRLVANWNDALADSIAAMNLYLDESKERRPRRHLRAVDQGTRRLPERRTIHGRECFAGPLAHALRQWAISA